MRIDRRKTILAASAAALGLALVAVTPETRARQDEEPGRGAAERAGAQLDGLLNRLRDNFRDLSEDVRRRFAEAQEDVEGLGVEARVYGRLHWDKALSASEIAVEVQEGNVVVLHGTVADAELRRKAVRLAVETVGVDRVKDNLIVPEAPVAAPRL